MSRGVYLALHLIPAAMLIAALGPWPYGYYTLLRLVVCIVAGWLAVLDYRKAHTLTPWAMALGILPWYSIRSSQFGSTARFGPFSMSWRHWSSPPIYMRRANH
jgi:hypothetical protein